MPGCYPTASILAMTTVNVAIPALQKVFGASLADIQWVLTGYMLGLAAEHAGHSAQAREQFAAAEKFWGKADKNLPELRRIQEGVSARR